MSPIENDPITEAVIGAAIEVHKLLGPGLLESLYQKALCRELMLRGIPHRSKVAIGVEYKGAWIGNDLEIDLLVTNELIVEIKSVEKLQPVHEAQLITYLKLADLHKGLLINFNEKLLKNGLRRRLYGEPKLRTEDSPPAWFRE
ncbi:GxxExxY protein [Telmatocola sphagniphila]|uniref:GxxExxY protein n=1 Tax=Telmatocola sphagniphila TaxID=1123043 RepID=A0A8E6ETI5_9BACT|nr:GxxExxY protein [Telmatocola sphagniphila]QVL30145.1 GxxExxY protein [Telmatocola sphagniphila]